MSQILKQITYLTQKDLKKHDIVLPSTYSNTFKKFAKELSMDIEDEEVVLQGLKQDLDKMDFIVKETNNNINTLKESTQSAKTAIEKNDIESLTSINKNIVKMQEQIEFLEKELFSDSLTKAYNRKWFSDVFLENDNFKEDGSLAFIDIDKFKLINDNYGHLLGDQVLKYLVQFLTKELKDYDVRVVRYAGDEFMLIFASSIDSNLKNRLLEVQKKLSSKKLKSGKVNDIKFTFSFGLVNFKKEQDLSTIINDADELMYKNKKR